MKTIYFPAGTEHVQFGGLAQLMASASNPLSDDATDVELIAHGGARLNWEEELLGAAKSGALPIKDSYTLGPCSYAVGFALQCSLVSIDDLRVFLAGRPFAIEVAPSQRPLNPALPIGDGLDLSLTEQYERQARDNIAAGRCTLHEAAMILNIDTKDKCKSILETMEAAAKSGLLPVFNRGRNVRTVYQDGAHMSVFETETRCVYLNKWLDANEPDIKYRFPVPPEVAPITAPAQYTATAAPVVPAKRREKKPSIETVALDYMRAEFRQGHFQSAAKFHKHLRNTAGMNSSPFEMGTGINARKLFCPDASSFFGEGTLGKIWAKIRVA